MRYSIRLQFAKVAACLLVLLVQAWGVEGTAQACDNTDIQLSFSYGSDVKMANVNSSYCWLTSLSGDYSGTGQDGSTQGSEVLLENDGFWHLISYQPTGKASAACIKPSCFQGAHNGFSVEWDNVDYPQFFWNAASLSNTDGKGGCDYESNTNGYPGIAGTQSSLTMLQGWPLSTGATNGGGGEGGGVIYNAGTRNTLWSQTCVTNEGLWGSVEAAFSSLFVGTLGTTVPVYPWSTGWSYGQSSTLLGLKASQAICFLTGVSGKFRKTGNGTNQMSYAEVWIDGNDEWNGGTGGPTGTEAATYACMGYFINH